MATRRSPDGLERPAGLLLLDLSERAIVLILFAQFLRRFASRFYSASAITAAWDGHNGVAAGGAILLLTSELLPVYLIIIRRLGGNVSARPIDWILGFAGVSAALLAHPAAPAALSVWMGHLAMMTGLLLQIFAKVALGTSFGVIAANRGVRTGGPYMFVRHPMYLGYSLTHLGFLIGYPSVHNTLLYSSVLLINIARLMREEQMLEQDPAYRSYAGKVCYRMIPGVF